MIHYIIFTDERQQDEEDHVGESAEHVSRVLLIGAGATVIGDLWAVAAQRTLNMPLPDWALVGRWFGHLARGTVSHENIAKAPPVRGERVLGWIGHYAIGVAFAALLVEVWGLDWARSPILLPALIVGWLTLAAPFLAMQPAMGNGFAASKSPNPAKARLRSLVTHSVFGIGLYVAAVAVAALFDVPGAPIRG
jgi:hypothetical protein